MHRVNYASVFFFAEGTRDSEIDRKRNRIVVTTWCKTAEGNRTEPNLVQVRSLIIDIFHQTLCTFEIWIIKYYM